MRNLPIIWPVVSKDHVSRPRRLAIMGVFDWAMRFPSLLSKCDGGGDEEGEVSATMLLRTLTRVLQVCHVSLCMFEK